MAPSLRRFGWSFYESSKVLDRICGLSLLSYIESALNHSKASSVQKDGRHRLRLRLICVGRCRRLAVVGSVVGSVAIGIVILDIQSDISENKKTPGT